VTCEELTRIVTDYLEGKMSLVDRARFQLHLGICGACREYVAQMKQTIRLSGKLEPEPIPVEVRDELLRRFRDWKRRASDPGS
jgi:predicted anti-sigma-YlaC factor YlaD